jgi:hypothetical protein
MPLQVTISLASLAVARSLDHSASMHCELWLVEGGDPLAALAAPAKKSVFLGFASLPLLPNLCTDGSATLVAGSFPFRNVLEGYDGGLLTVLLKVEAVSATSFIFQGAAGSLAQPSICPSALPVQAPRANVLGALSAPSHGSTADINGTVLRVRRKDSNLMVVHAFQVHILSMCNLPDAEQLYVAGKMVPAARYIRY